MPFLVPDCQYEFHVGAFGQHGMSLVLTSIMHTRLDVQLVLMCSSNAGGRPGGRPASKLSVFACQRSEFGGVAVVHKD